MVEQKRTGWIARHVLGMVVASCIVLLSTTAANAISFGKPGGGWPKNWPQQLEPFRKHAWTWEHGFGGTSYDIPFATRDEFEAAWPFLLELKDKGAPITLVRGQRLRVKKMRSAGARIVLPRPGVKTGPLAVTSITLVVDGDIVDLNRIRLPADTPLIDRRFGEPGK